MAKTAKDTIRIVSFHEDGTQITIEAPARPLSMKVLHEVEALRTEFTDFNQLASLVASMAEAGFDDTDETMKPFKQLIKMFEKGMTEEQAVALLRKDKGATVIKNGELSVELLRKLMVREQLKTTEKELLDSEISSDFWQNADLALIREQAEDYFRRYQ